MCLFVFGALQVSSLVSMGMSFASTAEQGWEYMQRQEMAPMAKEGGSMRAYADWKRVAYKLEVGRSVASFSESGKEADGRQGRLMVQCVAERIKAHATIRSLDASGCMSCGSFEVRFPARTFHGSRPSTEMMRCRPLLNCSAVAGGRCSRGESTLTDDFQIEDLVQGLGEGYERLVSTEEGQDVAIMEARVWHRASPDHPSEQDLDIKLASGAVRVGVNLETLAAVQTVVVDAVDAGCKAFEPPQVGPASSTRA